MQRERVIDRKAHQVSEFSSIANFLKVDEVPAGILTIMSGGIPIDLLVSPAASRTTICFFHGAIEPHFTLPVLSGLGVSGGIEANRVFISDPSLLADEELTLSWYAGNRHQPELQKDITAILKKVTRSLGSERIIFFGGSGGGFASLYFSSQFVGSLAVIFNPQTNIIKYNQQAVGAYAEKSFCIEPGHELPLAQLPKSVTTDLCDLYRKNQKTQIAYIQNLSDEEHVQAHLLPFIQSMHAETEVLLLARTWRDGHSPPPKDLLSHVLDITASTEDWSESLKSLGFIRVHKENFVRRVLPHGHMEPRSFKNASALAQFLDIT